LVVGRSGEAPSVSSWMKTALLTRPAAYFVIAELAFALHAPHQYADP
jgi:hypothetical protein